MLPVQNYGFEELHSVVVSRVDGSVFRSIIVTDDHFIPCIYIYIYTYIIKDCPRVDQGCKMTRPEFRITDTAQEKHRACWRIQLIRICIPPSRICLAYNRSHTSPTGIRRGARPLCYVDIDICYVTLRGNVIRFLAAILFQSRNFQTLHALGLQPHVT